MPDGETTAAVLAQEVASLQGALEEAHRTIHTLQRELGNANSVLVENETTLRTFFNANDEEFMAYWDGDLTLKMANFMLEKAHMPVVECVHRTQKTERFEAEQNNRWFDYRVIPAINASGELAGVAVFARDITQRKEAERKVRHLAYFDSLTDLPNRMLLRDRLSQAMAYCKRHQVFGAVLFLDLDRFKNVNDSLGHSVGDELLKGVARRLNDFKRIDDTVSRMGGDEFVCVLSNIGKNHDKAAKHAHQAAERLIKKFSKPLNIMGRELRISPSIGISIFSDEDVTTDDVIKRADVAMYRAKSAGPGRACLFQPSMQETAVERLELETRLHDAIIGQRMALHFQPQIHVDGGYVTGAETLIRWLDPELGFISPAKFIPIAEETGLILELGAWILDNACGQAKQWLSTADKPAISRVAVNISPLQFGQVGFVDQVRRALDKWQLPPESLELELTEGIVIADVETTIDKMKRLEDVGVRFSIDDFGTGYSSLAYLKRLPLDVLKIDQSFIRDVSEDENSAAIVASIISMGKLLGFELIAEGVETADHLEFLKDKGCENYQGYYFSKPLPVSDLETVLGDLDGYKLLKGIA